MSEASKYQIEPELFGEAARNFDFDSPRLGVVNFPQRFIVDYVKVHLDPDFERNLDQSEKIYAAQTLGHGPIMFESIESPEYIYSINRILDDSLYAEPGSIILPPGLYVIAECYDSPGKVYLMINLAEDSPDYGKLFYWRKAHDALGTGDNTTPPVWAADTLADYFDGLMTEEEARAKLQVMACRRKPEL